MEQKFQARRLVALGLALTWVSCGGGGSSTPQNPTAPITTQPPSTQGPAPTPTVAASACTSIGFGPGSGEGCPRESPSFLNELDQAIDQTVQQYPHAFDTGNINGAGGFAVLSDGQFYVGVIKNLNARGLCAGFDGEEIWIKNSNAFNDQYHILSSNGHIRRGDASYRASCYPAAMPKPEAPLPPTVAGCTLPSSRDIACGREPESKFLGPVQEAIQHTVQTQPQIFNGAVVIDVPAYHAAVVSRLTARGYCAKDDGDEIAIKNTNDFSEQYQIDLSSGRIRDNEGSYRSSCYPAAF